MDILSEVKNWREFTTLKHAVLEDLSAHSWTSEPLATVPTLTIKHTQELVRVMDTYILLLEELVRASEVDLRYLRAHCRSHDGRPHEAPTYASTHGT